MNQRDKNKSIPTKALVGILAAMLLGGAANAQCTFSSGSSGADGAFTPTNSMPATGWSISNNVITVTNKSDGVFNFTSVYVETNWVVKFTKNALNTPVYLLATTNVTIRGTLDVSGTAGNATQRGIGGPGGFDGGNPGADATTGFGPGGGFRGGLTYYGAGGSYATVGGNGYSAPTYGVMDVLPLIGGSGGGARPSAGDGGGGGAGGAILLASSGTITVDGTITALGGSGGSNAGCGSGGAIRLIAKTIAGEGLIQAAYSCGSYESVPGAGRVRLEACNLQRAWPTIPGATYGTPGVVFPSPLPSIKVTTIAGQNTPWPPAGSLTAPDVYLPTNMVNPVTISVSASNVNPGTTFKLIIVPSFGTNIVNTSTLSGSYSFSTGSVNMNVYTDRVWRVNALIDYIPRP